MSHSSYQDPKSYLNNAVTKRGKSGTDGVYLTNVTVVAECSTDYKYKVNTSGVTEFRPPFGLNYEEWLELLVSMRGGFTDTPVHLYNGEALFQFMPDGGSISLNVFIPCLNSDVFEVYVQECQEMLQLICDFSGKLPTFIRFSIGYAFRKWGTLVEEGEVQEYDLSF